MSVLGGVGYPDFTRVDVQAGPPFVNRPAGTVFGATTLFGPFYCGNWKWLRLRWRQSSNNTGVYRIEIFFYADAAATQQTGQRLVEFAFDAFCHQVFPVGGQYCVLQWEKVAAPSSTGQLLLQPLQVRDSIAEEVDTQITIKQLDTSVGAGATLTMNGQSVLQGWAALYLSTSAAVWQATLYGLDSNGNTWALAQRDSTFPNADQPEMVAMPGITHQLRFHNGDAAAKLLRATLVFLGQQGVA